MKSGTCTLLSGVGRNWICGLGVCCPKLAFSGEAEGKISKRRLRKSLVNQVSSTCPSSKCHPERNRPCTDFFAGQSLLPPTPTARLGAVYRGLALQVQNALKKTLRLTPFVASRRPRPSVPYEQQLSRSAEQTALAGRNSAGGSPRFGFEHLGRNSLIGHPCSGLITHPRDDHPVGVLRCCRTGFQGLTPPGY